MTTWKARVGDGISAAFALLNSQREKSGCRVLMYHSVGGDISGDVQRLYGIAPNQFRGHVRCLAETFDADVVALSSDATAGHGLAITFDDGYRDNLTVAAPLLVDAKMPFTVFVTPDFIGRGQSQYLSRNELQELANLPGVTIGAHGRSHRRLTECNNEELANELSGSRLWIEDLLGQPIKTMSYPHGAVDPRVHAAVADAGYSLAACSRFGVYRKGDDPLAIARTEIWADDDTARLMAKAAGHWDWMAWRK